MGISKLIPRRCKSQSKLSFSFNHFHICWIHRLVYLIAPVKNGMRYFIFSSLEVRPIIVHKKSQLLCKQDLPEFLINCAYENLWYVNKTSAIYVIHLVRDTLQEKWLSAYPITEWVRMWDVTLVVIDHDVYTCLYWTSHDTFSKAVNNTRSREWICTGNGMIIRN